MAFGFHRRAYIGITVNLASADTDYNLLALINAALAAQSPGDSSIQAPGTARELNLQNATGNSNSIFVGDSNLSGSNMGVELVVGSGGPPSTAPGASRTYRSNISNVDVGSLYVRSPGTNQKLNVELEA